MSFRFTLDNWFVLADEPKGWDSAKITIKRNGEFGGLFKTYVGEYEFWGEGYSYIKQQIDALGYCFSIPILIEYSCNGGYGYQTAFEGFINIKNAEIDNEQKFVRANIEPDDVYSAFLSSSGNEYNLYTTTINFPNGSTVTVPSQQVQYHFVEDGSFYLSGVTRRAVYFRVFEMLNFLVQANTQGKLSVVSEFFTNTFSQVNKWEVTLGGTTLAAGTINVTYVNQFGQEKTVSQAFNTSEANTLTLLATALLEETSNPVSTTDINTKGFLRNYFTHVSWPWAERSGRKVILESWLPYTIKSVSITSGTVGTTITATETQAYQIGGGELFMTNQTQESFYLNLPDIADTRTLSFDKLFKELDALFYLGMSVEGTPGNYQLRIEPMDYYFNTAAIFRINSAMNIRTTFNVQNTYNSVLVGSEMEYATHTYEGVSQGVITGFAGDTFVSYEGANPTEFIWRYLAIPQPGTVGIFVAQVVSITPPVLPATAYKFNLRFALPGDCDILGDPVNFNVCEFNEKIAAPSLLNAKQTNVISDCIGEQLNLSSSFVSDIEAHGDQVSTDYQKKLMNGSAANNSEKWTFVQCDEDIPSFAQTRVYKAKLVNNGVTYTRYPFNGHLTNHHKVINSFSRIRYNCFFNAKNDTEAAGEILPYINTSTKIPSRLHEFEYYISYSEMLSLISQPDVMIEVDIEGKGEYVACWIEEVEMDINTKLTKFKLYEN